MHSIKKFMFCSRKVISIDPASFFITLVLGLGWRFTLICGYVFSIHALGMLFKGGENSDGMNPDNLSSLFGGDIGMVLIVLILFSILIQR